MKQLFYLGFLISIVSCQVDQEASSSQFKLLSSSDSGLDFVNNITETDSFNIIRYLYFYNGAGVGAGDLNGDGLPDLVFNSNQGNPVIYLNESDQKIQLKDISKELQLDTITGWGTGVALADVNGDALLDIYLCQVGSHKNFKGRNRLLINKGAIKGMPSFVEETEKYGLGFSGLSTQASFFDYDLDGDLDMYLLNHSTHQTSNYADASVREIPNPENGDRLYLNDGSKFLDITETAGIYSSNIGYGLGIAISDLDNNGYPDIYIANDFHENDYIYWNDGGEFREGIRDAISRTSQFSMGVDIADINEDGANDIFTLDMMPPSKELRSSTVGYDPYNIFLFKKGYGYHDQFPHNHLQISNGLKKPVFSEQAAFRGVESTDWSWSCLFEDYDLDGDKDLFVSNGIMRRPNGLDYLNFIADPLVQEGASDLEMLSEMPSGVTTNYFFDQGSSGKFSLVNTGDAESLSNGAVYVDLDNDGDLEIVTNNINSPAFIYENISSGQNNFLKVKLEGLKKNTFGIGAKLEVHIDGKVLYREFYPQKGFMSSVDPVVNFGLGHVTSIESLVVKWPNGLTQTIKDIEVNKTITITEKTSGNQAFANAQSNLNSIFEKVEFENELTHSENEYNDLDQEKLSPQLYSREGPALAVTDIDGDGNEEFFLGGAKNQTAGIYAIRNASFLPTTTLDWESDFQFEDTDALFFDSDGDGDKDLYVTSGGHDSRVETPLFRNRVYINQEKKNFEKQALSAAAIPLENSSCVTSADFDNDGDLDLFVGTRVDKYKNAKTPISYILENDGNGNFNRRRENALGMVTDAEWGDIDNDGDQDLVVVGDWMPITLLINKDGSLIKKELPNSKGWWRSLTLEDIDGDNKLDIIAGNFGLNNNLEVSKATPLKLHVSKAGQSYMTYGNGSTIASADEIVKQMPQFRRQFNNYEEFSKLNAEEFFQDELLETKEVTTFETSIFKNSGRGNFKKMELPHQVQVSSVNSVVIYDVNRDGLKDIIFAGNEYHLNTRFGKNDASLGVLLLQNSDGGFESVNTQRSGLELEGMIRNASILKSEGVEYFLFAANNGPLQVYQLRN